ncbi:MAG: NHLP family bacteriocin export ABC transporter peptidase/permease/ATPase subunit [Cyanobacteria bacterium J06643_5]
MFQKLIPKSKPIQRTPTLLQMEAVECGAASLGMILAFHKRIVPLAELRQTCGVSRDGSKATNILKAAKVYGLESKGFKVEIEGLKDLQCPYIVFWNFNHFVVVEGFNKNYVFLNDPAMGRRKVSLSEFSDAYTGVVLVFEPGEKFQKGGRKPSLFLSLSSRLQNSSWSLFYCVLVGFLLVLPGLAMPTFSRIFVDQILIHNREDWLRPLILAMLFTAVLTALLSRLQLQLLRRLKIKLAMGMSSKFIWHLLHLPVSFYDQRFAGEISSRIKLNNDLANLLSGKLATTVISAVMVVFYAIVMWQYDQVLTLIGIAFVVINISALQWVARLRTDTNIRLMQEQGKVSGIAISGLQSIETLKASGLESDFFNRWAGYYSKAVNVRQEMSNLTQNLGILPTFLSGIASMLLLAVGGLRVMDDSLTIGMLVAFQSLMQQFMQPVNQLISLGSSLQEVEGKLNRLDDVLSNPQEEITQDEDIKSYISPKLAGFLELNNITFGYNRTAPPLIENFSLLLKPGQRVALVGGSGSGKSTVAKLVAGLYQPWDGYIKFDGELKNKIPSQVLVNSIATIEQDIKLFAGTVRDNLTLWDTTIPDSSLMQACRDAAIHEIILSLPGGYNADLMEGAANLSGGQRQRLEIARALVNNPSILLMDEATSALDTQTERIIEQNLRLRGCTCLIVAHRLSSIRDCDEIIVLHQGKVVQRGSHEELIRVPGHYLQLVRSENGVRS